MFDFINYFSANEADLLLYSPFDDLEEYLDHILKKKKSKNNCHGRKRKPTTKSPLNDTVSSNESPTCDKKAKKCHQIQFNEPTIPPQSSEDYELMMERMQLQANSNIHFA